MNLLARCASDAWNPDLQAELRPGRLLDAWGTGVETTLPRNIDPYGYNAKWGYYYDRETALYLCQRRMYDASAGRWLNRDPIGYAGGMNLYGYCAGGPVGWADPRGLDAMDDFLRWGSNFFGGWGDALTFGGTDLVRDAMGTNEYVDKDSGWYAGGNAVGTIHGTAIMPAKAAPEGTALLFTNGGRKGAHSAYQFSKNMRRNLERDGRPCAPGEDAAHVVARKHKRAQAARDKMDELGIPVDHPINGFRFIRQNHRRSHTNQTLDEINQEIGRATSISSFEAIAKNIARRLGGRW